MRAITGLIGKARPEAINYRAGNATIGIRGTDFAVLVKDDAGNRMKQVIAVTVNQGSLVFRIGNGPTITIPTGSGTVVSGDNTTPVVTSRDQVGAALSSLVAANPELQGLATAIASLSSHVMTGLITAAANTSPLNVASLASTQARLTNIASNDAGKGGGLPSCSTVVSPIRGRNCF